MADDRDDAAARLDRRVAEAADAWLADPRDTGVYARLVSAVTERRAVLDATVPDVVVPDVVVPDAEVRAVEVEALGDLGAPGTGETGEAVGPGQAVGAPAGAGPVTDGETAPDTDPDADPDDEPAVPLRPVGADLVGDPRAVLDRLRRG
ncbi:MAG: hypothetical protein HY830_08285 [Actinobacteria bacterium]|nr:hypothetical protein [Actinomycetota bacterium]